MRQDSRAERFRLTDCGFMRDGYAADIVIFDPGTVADRANWKESRLHPIGIDRVMVNGKLVILDGAPTGKLSGQVVGRGA